MSNVQKARAFIAALPLSEQPEALGEIRASLEANDVVDARACAAGITQVLINKGLITKEEAVEAVAKAKRDMIAVAMRAVFGDEVKS